MRTEIIELSKEELLWIEDELESYDNAHMPKRIEGGIAIGIKQNGELIAGADACMTAFKILYISTVFVKQAFRGRGIGKMLMREIEHRARALGASLIRLDTFGSQGPEFYRSLGYEEIGFYECKTEGFAEHFFIKRL